MTNLGLINWALRRLPRKMHERRARRTGPWYLVGVLIRWPIFLFLWYWGIQFLMYLLKHQFPSVPKGTVHKLTHLGEFSIGLIILSPIPLCYLLAAIIGNVALYSIPPARRSFEKDAEGYEEMRFKSAMKSLFGVTLKYALPISVLMASAAFVGIWLLLNSR